MKGNMKAGLKVAVLALLVAVLSVALAGEAQAKPKWLSAKLKHSAKFVNDDSGLRGEWTFAVTIINDSDDRIVTQLSEMQGTANCAVWWYLDENPGANASSYDANFKFTFGSDKAYEVELAPGDSKTYTFKKVGKVNNYKGYKAEYELEKWSFDCATKSKKEK